MQLYRPFLILSCILLLSATAFGQKKTISGVLRDSINHQPLSRASIRNINNGTVVISKTDGSFLLELSPGQIIAFSANGYFTDTLTISQAVWETGLLQIELKPLPSTLVDVVVTGNYTPYQLDSMARRREFLEVVGENKIPTVSRPNDDKSFGVAVNLDHFSKKEKRKRNARDLFEITEEEAYINYRWNNEVVAKYTNLQDEALISFLEEYRPSYAWLRKHPQDVDVLYYINDRLKREKNKSKNSYN
jgi:hypothetical protein